MRFKSTPKDRNTSLVLALLTLISGLQTISGLNSTIASAATQLPNPIAVSATAGASSGSIKLNFSAGFGDQTATTQGGS